MGIVGDGRWWLVGKIQRGDGGYDIVRVGEQRGCIGSKRWGREEDSFVISDLSVELSWWL